MEVLFQNHFEPRFKDGVKPEKNILAVVCTVAVEVSNSGLDVAPNKLPAAGGAETVVPCVPKETDMILLKSHA